MDVLIEWMKNDLDRRSENKELENRDQIQTLQNEIAELSDTNQGLITAMDDQKQELLTLNVENSNLSHQLNEKEKFSTNLKQEVNRLLDENKQLIKVNEEFTATANKNYTMIQTIDTELVKERNKRKELDIKLKALVTQKDRQHKCVDDMKRENIELGNEIVGLISRKQELQERAVKWRDLYNQLANKSSKKQISSKDKIQELTKKCRQLSQEFISVKAELTRVQKQSKHFRNSSEINKRKCLINEIRLNGHRELRNTDIRIIHESTDASVRKTFTEVKEKIDNILNTSLTEFQMKNNETVGDVIENGWKRSCDVDINANKIKLNLNGDKINCCHCDRYFSGYGFLHLHLIKKHGYTRANAQTTIKQHNKD
ncbi:M protein, serotype 6-like [Oppia nitens]|uniref:M protein, serotype 6-like n=1 Tax=Oppia nitens TaxID=1686743 RepID=UPI0023DC4E5C|nr:M protein, serotype 6-like [Oppia nitens]